MVSGVQPDLVVKDILQVLYAPHKAFKDIVQNPKYLGALLVLVIFVAVQVGSSYIVAEKSFLEQTMPTGDLRDTWTENAALWQAGPGVTVTENHLDYINATYYYNNTSIEFTADNSSSIQMALMNLDGSVNCGTDGFKNLSFRVKTVAPATKPENATLYLYSLSDSDFFSYDLTDAFSTSTVNVWNNITVPVGSGDWSSSGAPRWENISSLRMEFTWPNDSSIDLRVDGLFFRGIYKGALEAYGSAILINAALTAVTPFLFQWLLITGLMYLLIKGLRGTVVWKPLMVAVGLALITFVVQALILAIAFIPLWPTENYPLEVLAGVPGEYDAQVQLILDARAQVNLIGSIVQVAVFVWTIALGAFITRAITALTVSSPAGEAMPAPTQFGWLKCLLVSGASFLLSILILNFVFPVA